MTEAIITQISSTTHLPYEMNDRQISMTTCYAPVVCTHYHWCGSWYTDGGRWLASATGAMTSKVKVTVAKSRDQSEPSWPNAVACTCVISGRRRHTVSAETGSHTSCLIWGDLLRITCVRCIRTATWKLTFKSVFIGVHALSKLSYATHATQWKHGLQHNQTNGNAQCMHMKNNTRNWFYSCMCCVFRVHALHPLRCIRLLGSRLLSPFSAFWRRRLFWHSAYVIVGLHQPTMANVLVSSWMSSFWNLTIDAGPGYNYQSIGIKQINLLLAGEVYASVNERVCGGLTCRSPGSMLEN